MFTKMQKFYILAFSIATVLVFADASGFDESGLQPAAATEGAPLAGTTVVTVGEQALAGVQEGGDDAKTTRQQKWTASGTQTAATTAAAATTTVTLASSNAPATLTSANDMDEQVLNTAKAEPAAPAAEGVSKGQAQSTQLQQQSAVQAATAIGEAGENQHVQAFVKTDIRKAPTTATTIEINAAATPAMSIHSGNAAAGGTANKFGDAPTVSAESKSRADTLPPGNSAASNGGGAAKPKEHGNVAKTQIIKNAKELRTERLNEPADVYADELVGERSDLKVGEIETADGAANAELGSKTVTKQSGVGNKMETTSDIQPIVKENSETVQAKKPQEEETTMWLKEAVTTSEEMTGAVDTKTLKASYTDNAETDTKPHAAEKTTVAPEKDDLVATQTAKDGINIELRLKDGLYRIKLAEIVTDEYNGSEAEEKQQVQQATDGAPTAAGAAKASELLEIQVSSAEAEQIAGDVTAILPTHKQQKEELVTEQLGQHAQQTALTNAAAQNAQQQQSAEPELVQQQPQQTNQLRRKQLANKDIENRQVQQHNAHTASELDNMNGKHTNKNHEQNNKEQNDHVENTKHTGTVIGSRSTPQPTPPALNIVDLYPMKMEDFNPIIRDSNAKLLKERTVYKPTDSVEDQKLQQAEELYERADNVEEMAHQQNLLPNEVNAVDNIIQRYDNINNLAAARHSVNRRPNTPTTTTATAQSHGVVAAPFSQEPVRRQPDSISDFTGKLLAEQDGVITEIEQKFRLNEFAATPTVLATGPPPPPLTKATASKERQPAAGKTSYSVNYKVQPTKSTGNKYSKYKGAVTHRGPPQHDFIERRVKKSFEFPMHRTASVSDALGVAHVDFANTKFNTDGAATQSHSDAAAGGVEGAEGAMRAALGAHPEFSTTKFYNSKELYNQMMLHNREKLKSKARREQAAAAAIAAAETAARNTVQSAGGRFALRQSSKLETAKYTPNADSRKAIMGEVNMNSQRQVKSASVAKNATELRADSKVAMNVASGGAQHALKAKSVARHAEKSQLVTSENAQNAMDSRKMPTATTTVSSAVTQPAVGDKPTSKTYQKELQRAKLLLKTLLLPPTSDNTTSANKFKPTAATATTTNVIAAGNSRNYSHQVSVHTPQAAAVTPDTVTASHLDLAVTAKTFDITSLQRQSQSQAVTPPTGTDAAVGNIDSTIDNAMTTKLVAAAPLQRVNFDGVDIVQVKRAQPTRAATTAKTTVTTTTKYGVTTASTLTAKKRFSPTTPAPDDPTTPSSLIYPYPQLQRAKTTHISQPHDTTATVRSTMPVSAALPTSIITTTANLSKSSSKPIVRPRILSRLQEKINSLECEIQNVPSDAHLWRGNETHELLLPIMTSENCPYGGTDCTPLSPTWEGEAEIQSGDILIVEINDTLLHLNEHHITHTSLAHNTQVYQVTRSGHEHCDVTEGILLDITPLVVDGRKLVTLYDKDLTEGVNLLIVVSELWGSQCVRLKVTAKTDNCGESAECSGKGVCYSNSAMEEYECQCCSGFAGPHCEEIDACTPSPCTNNGICVDLSQGHEGNSYQCLCPYGYTGKNCQYESDPCNSAECMNGGSCVGNSTHFRCDCTPGYTGPLCQHSLNECESSPCVHGICVDQEDGFRCFCQPGFAGELCNFEYNECESNPCQNDGECIDHIGNFECRCTKGYTGARCQIKVDFCANKPCPDGHHCIDHGNDFSCECPGGRNGLDCNQMPRKQCSENLCKHGGTCWTSGASFYCACRPGYTGNMCEDEFVVETVVSSSEFMVDDTSARNFNDKTFGSSVVLKSPIELHNAYFGAGVLAAAVFIVAVVVAICHCKVNQTYRKFSTRSSTFFPILGFGRRSKSQSKLNKHWLSGKGLGGAGASGSGSLRSSGSTTSLTRGHLPSAHSGAGAHSASQQRQQQLQQQQLGGQMHERPFQRHLAMNLENDMYYTVDFSENSQHSPLIQ